MDATDASQFMQLSQNLQLQCQLIYRITQWIAEFQQQIDAALEILKKDAHQQSTPQKR